MGFGDYADAMEFRKVIAEMVKQELDKGRPEPTYGTVYSIDAPNRQCLVVMTGEFTPVKALLGSIIPAFVDQQVRLEGPPGARYVADVIGPDQLDANGGTPIGWSTPSLGTNVSFDSTDPLRYRVVPNNGARMLQLKGTLTIASGATSLFTLPAGSRPAVAVQGVLVGRDTNGSNVAQITANTSGLVTLVGGTVGVGSVGTTSGIGGGSAATSTNGVDIGHNHKFLNTVASTGSPDGFGSDDGYRNADNYPKTQGSRSNHAHIGGNHQHPITVGAVSAPTKLYLNGVSYFL